MQLPLLKRQSEGAIDLLILTPLDSIDKSLNARLSDAISIRRLLEASGSDSIDS
jgi:hypothetical protein